MMGTGKDTFSPNSAIDTAIKELLPHFSVKSQGRIRKNILNAKKAAETHRDENTGAGARHIFREFIPASILNQSGFAFEYEQQIQGKTPDWLDKSSKFMMESYTFERGGSSSFMERITTSVNSKCNRYKDIIAANSLRFVVAVYLDFLSGVLLDECREDTKSFRVLFDTNPELWALLFFTETYAIGKMQQYGFFCICLDSSFKSIPNWPFETAMIKPQLPLRDGHHSENTNV